jgi:hypothetical protein
LKRKTGLIFNQPSQSPITNVHDACIFPMMSKAVSRNQALNFRATLLKGEQLHQAVMNVCQDKRHQVTMLRAFAGHLQIVCSILHHKGYNKYLSEKGGLSFGIRKMFVVDEEGNGIIPITLAPQLQSETVQGQLYNERIVATGLKYETPCVKNLTQAKLSEPMKGFLMEHMDHAMMSEELLEVWYQISEEQIIVTE